MTLMLGTIPDKIYDDLFHNSIKTVGDFISLMIKGALLPLTKWGLIKKNELDSLELELEERLKRIPDDKLTTPDPYLYTKIINDLSFCVLQKDLRTLFYNLLGATVHTDKKGFVHPSFCTILTQLSPDEAKILLYLSKGQSSFPIINFTAYQSKELSELKALSEYIVIIKNWTCFTEELDINYDVIQVYIENLQRLGLIAVNYSHELSDSKLYAPLLKCKELSTFKINNPDFQIGTQKGEFSLTDFGKSFIDVCVYTED